MYINIPLLKKMYRLLRPFRKYYILIVFATIVSQILFNINNIIYGKLIEVITVKNIDSIILFVILATTLAILI
ncbi:MAG: hypothetical protein QM532_02730 [Cyanobium sp. MAG06]|nr:hypothetical protein [Cyanobium sp. MAG06]